MKKPIEFTQAVAKALCGGQFPKDADFDWTLATLFRLEDGNILRPYNGNEPLTGPGIQITTALLPLAA